MSIKTEQRKPNSEEWKSIFNSIKKSIGSPVQIPEEFGEYMIEYFTNCLPPILWSTYYVLCSEPYDDDPATGKERYTGFYKEDNYYFGIITTIAHFNSLR